MLRGATAGLPSVEDARAAGISGLPGRVACSTGTFLGFSDVAVATCVSVCESDVACPICVQNWICK